MRVDVHLARVTEGLDAAVTHAGALTRAGLLALTLALTLAVLPVALALLALALLTLAHHHAVGVVADLALDEHGRGLAVLALLALGGLLKFLLLLLAPVL